MLRPVADFRYPQFCPLARAAELLGERWTLLLVRDLLLGPRRFSDLKAALKGVSSSVLAARLERMEERGLLARRTLPPPAPATVYELTESGRALLPTIVELSRWGARFLGSPQPGDHFEPEWTRLGAIAFARRGASPARAFGVRVVAEGREVSFAVRGGRRGTEVLDDAPRLDATIHVEAPMTILALLSGALPPEEAIRSGQMRAEGDLDALADFPALFEMPTDGSGSEDAGSPQTTPN